MSELVSIGVKSIKRGPIADDGSMGTVLAPLGNTYKDSASLKASKPTVFNVLVEEQDNPVKQFLTKQPKTLAFSIIDWDPETIVQVLGGSVVNGIWHEPKNAQIIEESYQVITQTDVLIEIPKGSVLAYENADLKKGAAAEIAIEVTPLQPDNIAYAATMVSNYTPPVVSAGNAQNLAAAMGALIGTADAYRGTITSQVWTCDLFPAGEAAPGITTPDGLETNITGLVNGVYKFRLTVQDSNGYSNSATVQVTVAL